jgi:hypothetical protein
MQTSLTSNNSPQAFTVEEVDKGPVEHCSSPQRIKTIALKT